MAARNKRLREIFDAHDADGSGVLDVSELEEALRGCGVDLTGTEHLQTLLLKADTDANGTVSFPEFCLLFDEGCLLTTFRQFDTDGSGSVTLDELRRALSACGVALSSSQLQHALREVDSSGDGTVSEAEFLAFFATVPMASLQSVSRLWSSVGVGGDVGSDLVPPIPPSSGENLSLYVAAGGLGGVFSRTLTAPLERVKIQAQVSGSLPGGRGVLASLREVARAEGIRGLFNGNMANCVRVLPHAGIGCLAYSRFVKWSPADSELDRFEAVWRALAGAAAGSIATLATFPLDTVRARLTLHADGANLGIMGTASSLVREGGGVRALYAGLTPTLLAVAPFVAAQQASYDVLKMFAMERCAIEPSVPLLLGCGAAAGVVAQSVCYPLDVLRRRVQVAPIPSRASDGIVHHYTWLAAARDVFSRGGGVRALYAGITPTLLKACPAVAVSVTVRDACLGRL